MTTFNFRGLPDCFVRMIRFFVLRERLRVQMFPKSQNPLPGWGWLDGWLGRLNFGNDRILGTFGPQPLPKQVKQGASGSMTKHLALSCKRSVLQILKNGKFSFYSTPQGDIVYACLLIRKNQLNTLSISSLEILEIFLLISFLVLVLESLIWLYKTVLTILLLFDHPSPSFNINSIDEGFPVKVADQAGEYDLIM